MRHPTAPPGAPPPDDDTLVEKVREAFTRPNRKPPMIPGLSLRLDSMYRGGDIDLREVTDLVDSAPLITAHVLRVAQSPSYSRGATISSLDDAIRVLGLRRVSDLFLEGSLAARMFQAPAHEDLASETRAHAVICARAARLTANRVGLAGDVAFLIGLLHDIGTLASLVTLCDRRVFPTPVDARAALAAIERRHAEIGALVARGWGVPDEIVEGIAAHESAATTPLVACVQLADAFATGNDAPDEACALLGISTQRKSRLSEEVVSLARLRAVA